MFTTFSGSTKRPRQVNLSGRKTHAFGSPGTGAGSQAALDRAQQDRAQRQRERDTLKAAQTLQRLWRGYACRKVVSNQLRQEWDGIEGSAGGSSPPRPYDTEEEALAQLQRLLRFASPHNGSDTSRIQHYGLRQIATAQSLQITTRGPWPLAYLRLQRKMLRVLQDRLHRWSKTTGNTHEWDLDDDFLIILRFITQQIPAETSQNATQFYQTLVLLVIRRVMLPTPSNEKGALDEPLRILLDTTITPLTTVTGYTLKAYEAFDTAASKAVRDFFAASINYKLLANALATTFKKVPVQSHPDTRETSSRLILLACFVYFHRFAHNFKTPEADSAQKDFVTVISLLLNSLPINIIEGHGKRADQNDETASSSTSNVFLREQILSLINKEGIGNLLAGSIQSTDSSEDEKVDEARQLANYALALLRFFPRRGDEIRMWLYIGPSNGQNSSRKLPAIRYFWEASKRSLVFGTILKDSRAAIELLKHKAAVEKSSSSSLSWQPAEQEIERGAALADEWRVILVFLELYTFVLKVTDDEEFFSGGNEASSGQIRDNALPLPEVKELTTFLKNLGFTLYFNASDIISTDERDTSSTGLTFFNPKAIDVQPTKPAVEPSVGGVAGLSLDYVKGLVTGLLRMVYERDSRRKFLPSDHWLMTSRFDMSGFIPAVVQEEESRHKIEEEDAEDIDDDDDDDEEDELDDTPQLIGTSRTQQQRRQERLVREQRKASRRRYLQAVAPRLEILQNMPFFIPFTTRVQIFREFVHLDMTKRRGAIDPDAWRSRVMLRPDAPQQFARHAASIRREHEFEDAFRQFYPLGQGLKEPISITFVDQFDAQEAGIDGGGVTKEFLTSVTNRAFMPTDNIDMFIENDQHLLYPNPSAMEEQKEVLKQAGLRENSAEFRALVTDLSQRYEFLGRIIGKCLYEGILVDVNFAPFFLRKWALTGGTGSAPKETSYRPTLNDLRDLDEALYQGFHQLKTYPGNVEDFSLNFTVTDNIVVDHSTTPKKTKAITRELIPGGSDEAVTNQNRLVYITYMARHRLQNQPFVQTAAFLRGLGSMIQPSWLSMFNHSELQTLIGGTSSSIDIDDLRRNTLYGGTFVIGDDGLEHPSVQLFWKVLKDLSDGERRAVLKFVTSTPRAPLLGFGTLNPRFSIRDNGSDQQKLPTASTCVNLLKLPMYKDEATLKEKLLYSVFSGAGFDLS
ncbi:E3 ubiquitin-protein ligase NEDD4 [Aaosphaeria arxii CBS 175.79]|uniref:HECT-type E3 ubiquitin transferase n=1 Tax=Aaosphaeria arxii CBS 175.79 TaxID=1450172 RepID=A0A6A5Y6S5_9PLEO|nr:E3 ubiquitin-protein ligase NEDD4 [Aaosphaeria arxii CBS 175.79]KAF2020510.1 E3 ubiquitin-protein ligase NEDD4 [Aaosphaeria arxii CBS 175.79]